ncbi:hypothetical protein C8Q70DRAFT_507754 [Cubamyces menziesii]|nr:hypothetical protein C8Q70DRAFT_507754 [Cubamyces menziesii]
MAMTCKLESRGFPRRVGIMAGVYGTAKDEGHALPGATVTPISVVLAPQRIRLLPDRARKTLAHFQRQ